MSERITYFRRPVAVAMVGALAFGTACTSHEEAPSSSLAPYDQIPRQSPAPRMILPPEAPYKEGRRPNFSPDGRRLDSTSSNGGYSSLSFGDCRRNPDSDTSLIIRSLAGERAILGLAKTWKWPENRSRGILPILEDGVSVETRENNSALTVTSLYGERREFDRQRQREILQYKTALGRYVTAGRVQYRGENTFVVELSCRPNASGSIFTRARPVPQGPSFPMPKIVKSPEVVSASS